MGYYYDRFLMSQQKNEEIPQPLNLAGGVNEQWKTQLASDGYENEIKYNLITISIICNVLCLIIAGLLVYSLTKAITSAQTKSQKSKVRLYKLSLGVLISLVTVLILYMVVPFWNNGFFWCDFAIDLFVFIAILFWFAQWKESIMLYIKNRYVHPLRSENQRTRLTFVARISNLGKGIVHRTKNDEYSEKIVSSAMDAANKAFHEGKEVDPQMTQELQQIIYNGLLYKVGKVEMGCCNSCCHKDLSKKPIEDAINFQNRLYFWTIVTSVALLVVSLASSILGYYQYNEVVNNFDPTNLDNYLSANDKSSLPLSGALAVLTIIICYLLIVNNRLMTDMVDKDDPFSNAYLIAMLLLFNDFQRILFKLALQWYVAANTNEIQTVEQAVKIFAEVTMTRYATMAMEFLFIIIPLRHNFVLHHLEI